jgi:hypothetical protein
MTYLTVAWRPALLLIKRFFTREIIISTAAADDRSGRTAATHT